MRVGISAIEYVLGSDTVSVDELEARGALDSPAARLSEFGFSCARLSRDSSHALATAATNKLLCATGVDRASIGALFYAGATPGCHAVETLDPLSAFNYPVAQLQYELELTHATAFGVSQLGCLGLMASVTLAKDFLLSSKSAGRALCVSADVLPAGCKREMIYNVISDGACAVLVEKECDHNRILASRQVTKGYYWNSIAQKNEITAAYFPTARNIAGVERPLWLNSITEPGDPPPSPANCCAAGECWSCPSTGCCRLPISLGRGSRIPAATVSQTIFIEANLQVRTE
jgi:3-oxoacyl-[acyl-carrier-protein] synthase-3